MLREHVCSRWQIVIITDGDAAVDQQVHDGGVFTRGRGTGRGHRLREGGPRASRECGREATGASAVYTSRGRDAAHF